MLECFPLKHKYLSLCFNLCRSFYSEKSTKSSLSGKSSGLHVHLRGNSFAYEDNECCLFQ